MTQATRQASDLAIRPWQFSGQSLLLFIAVAGLIFAIVANIPEIAYWVVVIPTSAIAAFKHPSANVRFISTSMLLQYMVAPMFTPADGGVWFCTMQRLVLIEYGFLFIRLYAFYKVIQLPEPQLSELVKVAILTSPIYIAAVATYMGVHNLLMLRSITPLAVLRSPILLLIIGIGLSYLGYGPLSLKNKPTAGVGFALIGFVFRLAGPMLLVWDGFVLLFSISMIM